MYIVCIFILSATFNHQNTEWLHILGDVCKSCDRVKIGLIALHLNFTKLGLFMLNTVAIMLALAR